MPKNLPLPRIRPTPRLVARIARRYAAGESLDRIALRPWSPSRAQLYRWRAENAGGLGDALARARASKAEYHASQSLEVIETLDLDAVEDPRRLASTVGRADKLSGAHRWHAERLDPDTWGDRQRIDLTAQVLTLQAFPEMRGEVARGSLLPGMTYAALPSVATPDGAEEDKDAGE